MRHFMKQNVSIFFKWLNLSLQMSQNYSNISKDISSIKDSSSNQPKTIDVNILLNRVRLDKQKTFKKKILVSLLSFVLVCSIIIFLTI